MPKSELSDYFPHNSPNERKIKKSLREEEKKKRINGLKDLDHVYPRMYRPIHTVEALPIYEIGSAKSRITLATNQHTRIIRRMGIG